LISEIGREEEEKTAMHHLLTPAERATTEKEGAGEGEGEAHPRPLFL